MAVLLLLAGCGNPLDVCVPVDGRVGFFSRGDCVLTRASFFGGHEWLTWFGNDALGGEDRFTDAQIDIIVEGNRRVDFPKELLVHLNNGVYAYIHALEGYHAKRSNQSRHFLLDDRNRTPDAARLAHDRIREQTLDAISRWNDNRVRALTLFGQVCHTVQDAFSPAHTVRRAVAGDGPTCIAKVKAYMPRASGFNTPDIEFHGSEGGDNTGHTTSADSIYRAGRDCHDPDSKARVRGCLSEASEEAVRATSAYLRTVHHLVRDGADDDEAGAAVDAFIRVWLGLCSSKEPAEPAEPEAMP